MNKHIIILVAIVLSGLVLRGFSLYYWNQTPYHDVAADVRAAESFATNGTFQIGPPSDAPALYSLGRGRFLDQHPILWPFLGAALSFVSGINAFASLKILSLLSGLFAIFLGYVLGRRLINKDAGLTLAAFTSLSYILIDFSANGSLYAFHGALFLLWIFLVSRFYDPEKSGFPSESFFSVRQAIYLAGVSAAGLMLN
ncbi:MAG: hypothetical protein WD889_01305, partial [Candidatus Colwellbacteria bacterium]